MECSTNSVSTHSILIYLLSLGSGSATESAWAKALRVACRHPTPADPLPANEREGQPVAGVAAPLPSSWNTALALCTARASNSEANRSAGDLLMLQFSPAVSGEPLAQSRSGLEQAVTAPAQTAVSYPKLDLAGAVSLATMAAAAATPAPAPATTVAATSTEAPGTTAADTTSTIRQGAVVPGSVTATGPAAVTASVPIELGSSVDWLDPGDSDDKTYVETVSTVDVGDRQSPQFTPTEFFSPADLAHMRSFLRARATTEGTKFWIEFRSTLPPGCDPEGFF
jgi:hypothetical protein